MVQTELFNKFGGRLEGLGFKEFGGGSMDPKRMYVYIYCEEGRGDNGFEFTIPATSWDCCKSIDHVRTIDFFNQDHERTIAILEKVAKALTEVSIEDAWPTAKKVILDNGFVSYDDLHSETKQEFGDREHTANEFCENLDAKIAKVGRENLFRVSHSWPTYTNGTLVKDLY